MDKNIGSAELEPKGLKGKSLDNQDVAFEILKMVNELHDQLYGRELTVGKISSHSITKNEISSSPIEEAKLTELRPPTLESLVNQTRDNLKGIRIKLNEIFEKL